MPRNAEIEFFTKPSTFKIHIVVIERDLGHEGFYHVRKLFFITVFDMDNSKIRISSFIKTDLCQIRFYLDIRYVLTEIFSYKLSLKMQQEFG